MYDNPPEPTKEEIEEGTARQAARNTPIRIEGLTVAHIEHALRGIIDSHYGISERAHERLDKAIAQHVSKLVEETTKARIEAAVDKALAEGFPVFDQYTGRENSRTSVAEIVGKQLAQRSDTYNDKTTMAERAVNRAVEQIFASELKGVIATLKADFKKQADGVFKAKIVTVLKEAIGLHA